MKSNYLKSGCTAVFTLCCFVVIAMCLSPLNAKSQSDDCGYFDADCMRADDVLKLCPGLERSAQAIHDTISKQSELTQKCVPVFLMVHPRVLQSGIELERVTEEMFEDKSIADMRAEMCEEDEVTIFSEDRLYDCGIHLRHACDRDTIDYEYAVEVERVANKAALTIDKLTASIKAGASLSQILAFCEVQDKLIFGAE